MLIQANEAEDGYLESKRIGVQLHRATFDDSGALQFFQPSPAGGMAEADAFTEFSDAAVRVFLQGPQQLQISGVYHIRFISYYSSILRIIILLMRLNMK